jgi:hypothetical protein
MSTPSKLIKFVDFHSIIILRKPISATTISPRAYGSK